jgi:endo-1,4-beta-xylanase
MRNRFKEEIRQNHIYINSHGVVLMNNYQKSSVLPVMVIIVLTQICQVIYAQPLGQGKEKFIGCGTTSPVPSGFDSYWNQVSPGNEGKWGSVETARNTYNWDGLDQIYNYAIQKGLRYKHHTLIWGAQQPSWISALDSASQRAEIEEWIRLVGERYPLMDFVDVVNEPLPNHNPPDGGGSPARANYKKALGGNGTTGYDWVIKSFELARQYCAPGVKLVLNDYGIINDNNATTQYLAIINLLKARNLIDGIGVQGHRFELMNKDTAVLRYNLDRLAATGIPVYITEFDLGVQNDSTYNPTIQLSEYQRIFPVLWNHPGVKGITWWGYIQGQMWQVNTFLLYSDGSETPALTWLRNYLTTGNYRSHQTGNWSDANTWEKYDGTNWISPAPSVPAIVNGTIAIQNGHTVTVTANDSADQVSVLAGGTLVINSGVNLLIKNGTDDDLDVSGVIKNYGTILKETLATIKIFGTGKYEHSQDGGVIPIVEWGVGSTCELTSVMNTMPANIHQSFYNFAWNCPMQAKDFSLGWENGVTIGGTLSVANTNWNRASVSSPAHRLGLFNGSGNCTISTIVVNGSNAVLTAQGSSTTDTVTVTGNISLSSGGMLSLSNNSGGVTTCFVKGNLTVTDSAYLGESSSSKLSKIVFNNTGLQGLSFPATGVNIVGAPSIVVSRGSTLNMDSSVFGGTGSFIVESGAALQTAHEDGINGNIQCSGADGGGNNFSSEGSYLYSGVLPQVTGSYLPGAVADLTINNKSGITLTNSIAVNGTLEMKTDILMLGGKTLGYGIEGTLKYSGFLAAQTTKDGEFPSVGGPKNLVINDRWGVTLHASRELTGEINFQAGKLTLGTNTLTASSTANASTSRYVVTTAGGILRLTSVGTVQRLFPVGISTYAPVWITNTGIEDDIDVRVLSDTTSAPYGGRLTMKWNINEATSGGGNYTLQFGWTQPVENASFKLNRANNSRIYLLPDTLEAGTGMYTTQFTTNPYYVSRSGITALGSFVIGSFKFVTGVEDEENTIPKKFELSQNYPNPFNPSTIITYQLPVTSNMSLKVYNLLGQEVATLFEGIRQPGNYMATFDGRGLSGGVYLYRMTAANFVDTKKTVLLK